MNEESYSSPGTEILEALQSTLQSGIDAGIPGLSAAISTSNGIIWQSTAGYAVIGSQEPINSSHVFGIGSITKVFVAVVILQLVDENLLRITDLVEDYLEDEVLRDIEHAGKAKIGGLLSIQLELDPARIWGKTDALEYIRRPSSLTPRKFSYSNTNYTLLGLIIEKITHHSAESEIRRRVLTPLDLQDTYLEGFENTVRLQLGKMPHRYHYATETFRNAAGICPSFSEHEWKDNTHIDATPSNLSVEWTAGGMISSPLDLLKLAISIRDGKLLSPPSMKILQEWQTVAKDMEMGHGLFRGESPLGCRTWLGHHGSVLGFTGTLWWSEEGDCAVCVLANVGPMHAGDAPSSALQVAWESEFLQLAAKLSTKVPEDTMSIS